MRLSECPFCQWNEDPDQRLIMRNESAVFLQSEKSQGALVGWGMIVPVRHVETVFDLSLDEVHATFLLLADVKRWIDATYGPDGYNIGWNCGSVAGQEVAHAHLHVIPRFRQEPYAGRGIRFWLKQDANKWKREN